MKSKCFGSRIWPHQENCSPGYQLSTCTAGEQREESKEISLGLCHCVHEELFWWNTQSWWRLFKNLIIWKNKIPFGKKFQEIKIFRKIAHMKIWSIEKIWPLKKTCKVSKIGKFPETFSLVHFDPLPVNFRMVKKLEIFFKDTTVVKNKLKA